MGMRFRYVIFVHTESFTINHDNGPFFSLRMSAYHFRKMYFYLATNVDIDK